MHNSMTPREQRKISAAATRLVNRVASYVTAFVMHVRVRERGGADFPHLRYERAVTMAGLLTRSVETGSPVVIHLRDQVNADDDDRGTEVPREVILALRKQGWVSIAGKHLIPRQLLRKLSRIFPRAVDALAYLGGLCGPLWAGTFIRNCNVTVRTIRTKGKQKAGSDGAGRLHPKHPLYSMLDIVPASACAIQIRAMNLETGIFIKGILVPDERCLDEDGNPDIWVDWLQIKGRWKAAAKTKAKASDDPMSTLVVDLGVTGVFDRPVPYSWNYEILGWINRTEETCRIIDSFIHEAIDRYIKNDGDIGFFRQMAEEDEHLSFMAKALELLGLSPKAVPEIRQQLDQRVSSFRYLCVQGAGRKSPALVSVIDNGIPDGHAVMRPLKIDGEWKYLPGDEVAITRYPLVLPQALRTVKIIDPAQCGLGHILIGDHRGEKAVPAGAVYLSEVDLVEGLMGDDDGDMVIVDWDPRTVELFKNRLTFPGFSKNHRFLIEPEEAEGFAKSSAKTDTDEGLDILSQDGRGPVGLATVWQFSFLKLGKPFHALATGVLVQEFIDMAKRVVQYTDPRWAIEPKKWLKNPNGSVQLTDGCKFASDSVWVGEHGLIDMDMLSSWVKEQMAWAKSADLLPWRSSNGRIPLSQCEDLLKRFDGDVENATTLVEHCAIRASELLLRVDAISESEETVELPDLLLKLVERRLGVKMDIRPLGLTSPEYTELRKQSGLHDYGAQLHRICKPGLHTREERNTMIEAEKALLLEQLKGLADPTSASYEGELATKLLLIWVTETSQVGNKHYRSHLNRAFRAVLWEGSPILAIVDPDGKGIAESGCSFMTPERLRATSQYLKNFATTQHGREEMLSLVPNAKPSVFLATQVSLSRSVKHEDEMGIPLTDCPHCTKAVVGQVVSEERRDRSGDFDKHLGALVKKTNVTLGWPDYTKK